MPDLRRRRHHRASRAHAEAVDGAAVAGVVHQLVVGGAQQWMAGIAAEPGAVGGFTQEITSECSKIVKEIEGSSDEVVTKESVVVKETVATEETTVRIHI